MDNTSILRLELDHYNIDSDKSFETFDPSNHNHTIDIFFNKDINTICPVCKCSAIITGSKVNKITNF